MILIGPIQNIQLASLESVLIPFLPPVQGNQTYAPDHVTGHQ
mgnify:CR=1 FL=1